MLARSLFRKLLLLAVSVAAMAACSDDDGAVHVSTHGLLARSAVAWPQSALMVCWIDPRPEHHAERAWVQNAVEQTWSAASAVRFVGWGPCPPLQPRTGASDRVEVRITVGDVTPSATVGMGYWSTNVRLNFTFQSWATEACTPRRERCIRSIAIHEFGHVLGFDHEQNRADSTCPRDGIYGSDTPIGPYDETSVMNYCAPQLQVALSAGDQQGVRAMYGSLSERERLYLVPRFYLDLYDDLRFAFGAAGADAAANHFRTHGVHEGRSPGPLFDPAFYRSRYPDLAHMTPAELLEHWLNHGIEERRASSMYFDLAYYLAANPDVAPLGPVGAVAHYAHFGMVEGRRASAEFDPRFYLAQNPDVARALGPSNHVRALFHHAKYGRAENRRTAP